MSASAPTPDADAHDLDAIVGALARLRGRGPGGAGGLGGPFGDRGRGHGRHGHPDHGDTHGDTHGDAHGDAHYETHEGNGPAGDAASGAQRGPGWGHGPGRMAGLARMRMLEALAVASHPLSVSDVGAAIGVDQPRASRLIQQAVELGLVRREADPDDARRTRVALTDEGTSVIRGFRGQRREHLSQALADFTPDERADLARLLTKLAASWPQR